jgi:hypothetical protein
MSSITNTVVSVWDWIREDYRSRPFRFVIELAAWTASIGCAITMALTVPDPPLRAIYPVWIVGCLMYGWASWTRRSFGMLANYMLLTVIDTVGMVRVFVS